MFIVSFCDIFTFNKNLHYDYKVDRKTIALTVEVTLSPTSRNAPLLTFLKWGKNIIRNGFFSVKFTSLLSSCDSSLLDLNPPTQLFSLRVTLFEICVLTLTKI